MTRVLADALVPVFTGLLIGYLAGLLRVMDNQNVRTLITFVMTFAIPCSLFLAVATTSSRDLLEQAPTALVLAIVFIVLYAMSFFWARSRAHLSVADSAVVALTLGFPNSAAVGLPLLGSVFGPASTVAVATSLAIGSLTISPATLLLLESSKRKSGDGLTLRTLAPPLINSIRKPLVWAPVLGLVFACMDFEMPSFAHRSLAVIGSAADGSALVLTGLVVSSQKFEIGGKTLTMLIMKNALQPALALGLALLVGLSIEQTRYVTLISALPCGFFGVVFGKGFDACPQLASSGLIASYIVGVATLAAWIVIVDRLG